MRAVDGRLSRRAQVRLGGSSLVYREDDGSYTLERDDTPPLGLGGSEPEAETALIALHHAAHPRVRGKP